MMQAVWQPRKALASLTVLGMLLAGANAASAATVYESESNNSASTADAVSIGDTVIGSLNGPGAGRTTTILRFRRHRAAPCPLRSRPTGGRARSSTSISRSSTRRPLPRSQPAASRRRARSGRSRSARLLATPIMSSSLSRQARPRCTATISRSPDCSSPIVCRKAPSGAFFISLLSGLVSTYLEKAARYGAIGRP